MKSILPPAPAEIDIMSAWNQAGRPSAQWDGSIDDALHRNLAAEFGVVGDPAHLNMRNVNLTTPFRRSLPAAPYPFTVDRDSASRGKDLYVAHCASCGTDSVTCNHADGTPLSDDEILKPTGGYMAVPLDGIWARAPYLHNGSVPNLSALLTGDRPAKCWRGNINYDQAKIGFVSTSGVAELDTSRAGHSSAGHDTRAFLGDVDWKKETKKTQDPLGCLKTLRAGSARGDRAPPRGGARGSGSVGRGPRVCVWYVCFGRVRTTRRRGANREAGGRRGARGDRQGPDLKVRSHP